MIVAHLDCSSGVSGDKFLGALLDIALQTGKFSEAQLVALTTALAPEAQLEIATTSSYGIAARTIKVHTKSEAQGCAHDSTHGRSWAQIRESIEALPKKLLADSARTKALLVFSELARVEAQIHSTNPDDVHFHEIGAVDSIVDIVGACAVIDALGIKEIYATPPALGSGTVDTAHGVLPVPAPATAALLLGVPTSMSSAPGELTTPTGAALLRLVSGFGPTPPLTPLSIGYGAGTRDIGQPNICRLLLGELDLDAQEKMGLLPDEASVTHADTKAGKTSASLQKAGLLQREETVLLETNIDHIAPEAVAFAGEQLLAEGALDVWVTPIAMKKSRAALTLSVLSKESRAQHFAARMMKLTGTLGVRVSIQPRYLAQRESMEIETRWGLVQVKIGSGRVRPEHEDIARIARQHELDYAEVLREITDLALNESE